MQTAKSGPVLPPRPSVNLAAFVLGLPLAAGVLAALAFALPHDSVVSRYVRHPVEQAEVILFCCAVGALLAKLALHLHEKLAWRCEPLPEWDGTPVPVTEASGLLVRLQSLPRRLLRTRLVRRVAEVLDFVRQRRSAADLDDQVRSLADTEAMALETSYGLTRFITWAIPILGFLGTVVGITKAIAGVTPEQLEQNMGSVTDGLAEAFDTTALALGLTMLTMLCAFLVERLEQGIVEAVDRYTEQNLVHRFQRSASGSDAAGLGLELAEKLVQRQAEIWAQTLERTDAKTAEILAKQQAQLAAAVKQALEQSLQAHAQRLAEVEKQSTERTVHLFEQMRLLAEGVQGQTKALAQIQQGEKQLVQLQMMLQQNLASLAGAGTFEKAVHSLTAAVHLLTARTIPGSEATLTLVRAPQDTPSTQSGRAA